MFAAVEEGLIIFIVIADFHLYELIVEVPEMPVQPVPHIDGPPARDQT